MVDLTPVVAAILTLAVSLITAFLIPYLRSRFTADQLDTIKEWVNVAVRAAEMIFTGTGMGARKKQYVLDFLNSKGFTLNANEIDTLIEAAVLELKLKEEV